MILHNHNHSMNVAYEKLKQNDIQVYSIKTDAFVIDKCNLGKAKSLLKFGNGIGEWKYCNRFRSPSEPFCRKPSFLENITEYSHETCDVKDEWNTDEIIKEHIFPTERAGTASHLYVSTYRRENTKLFL